MSIGIKRFITCIVTILVLSIGMTLITFRTDVQAAIFGTKDYYLFLERDNFKELGKKYKDTYIEKYLDEYSYAAKAKAELGGELMEADPMMKLAADYLAKFELDVNYNVNSKSLKDKYFTSFITTKYDGKNFADIDIKSANNKTLISFPGLTEKTLGIEETTNSVKFIEAFLGDDKAFQEVTGLTRKAYDKMVEKYLRDVIFNQISDDNVVFDSEAKFENIECNSITFNIDQKVISNIYKAVAKELQNDKEVRILIKSITDAVMDTVNEKEQVTEELTAEKIDSEIKDLCKELNNEAEGIEEIQVLYTAYFKDNGDILSRQFNDKVSDTSVKLSIYKNLFGVDIAEFKFDENKETAFELIGSRLENASTYTGRFQANIDGKSLFNAEYSYEKDAKVGNLDAFVGEITGKINIQQFNDDFNTKDLSDIYFSYVNKKKDIDTLAGEIKYTTKVDGKSVNLKILTEVKQTNEVHNIKPEVLIDNSIKLTDYEELNEMGTEISESLQKKIIEIIPFMGGLELEDKVD